MGRAWMILGLSLALGCGGNGSGTKTPADAGTMAADGPAPTADGAAPQADVAATADGAAAPADTGAPPADTGAPAAEVGADTGVPLTDRQHCERSCARLIACGVPYDATCASNCLLAPVFLGCIKTAPQECNPLALCTFMQASAAFCGSDTAGYPAGTGRCGAAATCEGLCTAGNQPLSCRCPCWSELNPSRALYLLINNECAVSKCKTECSTPGGGAGCLACFAQKCSAENGQCMNN